VLNLSENPEYGDIILDVQNGTVTIVNAPAFAWISKYYLTHPELVNLVQYGDQYVIDNQLVYGFVGWDGPDVMVELVEDLRT